ncbi:hypothetical protein ACFL15_02475 [Patescibacteria group bacterium]
MIWLIKLVRNLAKIFLRLLIFLTLPEYLHQGFVVVESPFSGDEKRNIDFVRSCMRDCFLRGEFPFASHALYTQDGVLRDDISDERKLGIFSGLLWTILADKTAVYTDYGISGGMQKGISFAKKIGRKIEYRKLNIN